MIDIQIETPNPRQTTDLLGRQLSNWAIRRLYNAVDRTGAIGRREIRKRVRKPPKTDRGRKAHKSKYPYHHAGGNRGLKQVRYTTWRLPGKQGVAGVVGVWNAPTPGVREIPLRTASGRPLWEYFKRIEVKPIGPQPRLINQGGQASVLETDYKPNSIISRAYTSDYKAFPFVTDSEKRIQRALIRNVLRAGFRGTP